MNTEDRTTAHMETNHRNTHAWQS